MNIAAIRQAIFDRVREQVVAEGDKRPLTQIVGELLDEFCIKQSKRRAQITSFVVSKQEGRPY